MISTTGNHVLTLSGPNRALMVNGRYLEYDNDGNQHNYDRDNNILATRCHRLSTDSSCWRLAVLDFRKFVLWAPAGVLSHVCFSNYSHKNHVVVNAISTTYEATIDASLTSPAARRPSAKACVPSLAFF